MATVKKSSSARTVKITQIQAIGYIDFELPEGQGGVKLLRGSNGAGKTTALLCLNALLGKKASLVPTEGAPKGIIEGLGRTISIQKRASANGDVEVPNLEGRFDFSDLVEPPIKDAEARNKARIRSLVGLTGGTATEADFYELFGGQEAFEAVIAGEEIPESGDVLELADYLKKQTESLARLEETRLESEESRWQLALTDSKGHRPEDEPQPVAVLADEYSAAQRARMQAQEVLNANAKAIEHNKGLAQKLAQHSASKPVVGIDKALEILNVAKQTVADLEAKLATAKQTADEAKRRFEEAMRWEERLTELEDSMLQVADALPAIEPLEKAEAEALERLQSAEETKRRWDSAVQAKELAASITARREKAARLRSIAKRTNEVVTKKLPAGCPLQVKNGLLCAFHERRNDWVPFDQLSEGERWRASLQIAIDAVGEGGVLPCRQEAWQALDQDARALVIKMCQEGKVWLISGEVGEGQLRVEDVN